MTIDDFINNKFEMIAKLLPDAVDKNPAGFECGWATGYKQALLDIDRLLEDKEEYETQTSRNT
jgi:hypothetical protein